MTTFHKIDRESTNAITNALSFFDVPSTNVSVSSSAVVELLTLNPVNIPPYHFKIHASQSYFDLSKCYILLELRIRKEDAAGNLINLDPAQDHVAPCQMIGHTIWKNCRMHINGSQVFEGNALMAYKSWFDYMLTYPLHVKNSYLNAAGYYDDEELSQVTGRGLNARYQLFAGSRNAQFIAKLDLDICNQPRYIVNQCEIDLELYPNDSNFLLIAEQVPGAPPLPRYHLEVLACKMYVKKVELMDSLAFDINKKLEVSPAKYPMRKSSMRAIFITENRTEFNGSLWADQVPKRIILGLVTNSHYVGTQTSSPFDFRHFNVRDITISASGVLTPAAPYNFDFPNWKFARAYHDMQDACGFAGTLESNGISMNRYANGGCCVFVFNLTNSGEDNGTETFDLIRNGATTIKITFNQPVPAGGIVLIAMGEHESMLYLDRNRTVATDIQV
jgi:hypothetical protein